MRGPSSEGGSARLSWAPFPLEKGVAAMKAKSVVFVVLALAAAMAIG